MTTRRVALECGVAQTRAVLIVDDEVVGLGHAPARGDEALPRPLENGDRVVGRVARIEKSVRGAFLDLGPDGDGFLPVKDDEPAPEEGARIAAVVRRAAVGAKSPVLARCGSREHAVTHEELRTLGRVGPPRDASISAIEMAGGKSGDAVVLDDALALAALRSAGYAANFGAIDADLIEDAVESALARPAPLAGGGRMIFDETEGLTVVDVDAGAAVAGAGARLADRVNEAAAPRLFIELARRRIGGRVVVDFLPSSDSAARARLTETLRRSARGVYNCRFGRLAADGLFDLTAPRTARSLLEELTEPADEGFLRAGRRFTREAASKAAIGALERALKRAPSGRPQLLVGEGIGHYLQSERPHWRRRLEEKYGARFSIETSLSETGAKLKDRDHDLAE